jgi:hypothetical protein
MNGKLSEFSKLERAIFPQDIGTADVTSAYRDAKGYKRFRAHLLTAALTSGQTCFIQLMQAKAGGTEPKALGDAVTHTAPAEGSYGDIIVEASIDDLDCAGGFEEIAVKVGSGTNSKVGSAVLELGGANYLPATE